MFVQAVTPNDPNASINHSTIKENVQQERYNPEIIFHAQFIHYRNARLIQNVLHGQPGTEQPTIAIAVRLIVTHIPINADLGSHLLIGKGSAGDSETDDYRDDKQFDFQINGHQDHDDEGRPGRGDPLP